MKRMGVVLGIGMVVLFFVFCDAAMAGIVAKRQIRQQKRIYQGVRCGELSWAETRRLEREQIRVQRTKRRAWKDAELTPGERVHLERMQDRASHRIFRLKHNDVTR